MNDRESQQVTAAPSTPESPPPLVPPARRIRLWPALVILLLAGAVMTGLVLWAGEDVMLASMVIFMGVPLVGLLLGLWWVFASRLTWKARFLGLGLFTLWAGLVVVAAESDLRYFIISFVLPAALTVAVLWMVLAALWGGAGRLAGVVALALAVAAVCLTLRMDGLSGDFTPELAFRWSPEREDVAEAYWKAHGSEGPAGGPAKEPLASSDGDWTGFRGPRRDGVARGVRVRRDWENNPPKLLWKHPVGPGWSSFAVVGDLLYTQEQRREHEAVVCYKADTGEEVWAHLVPTRFNEATGDGPRATPTFHDGRLYTLGGTGVLACLDARTGHEFWSTNILEDNSASNIPWGMAGSPLVYDNLVVVSPGGPDGKSLVAYDRLSGERAWSAGSDPATYSSPQWAVLDGVPQVLIFNAGGLSAHDPRTGAELWKFPWPSQITNNTVQPRVLDGNTVLVSSIFVGTARLTVTREDGEWSVSQEWLSPRMKLYHNDMVSRDGYLYGLDNGILTCLDLKTGEPKWKQGRFRSGQLLLLEDQGLLLIQAEFGDVVLVEASPNGLRQIGRFPALEGKTWNHPVVAHGKLFVRNDAEAACYDVSPGGE